jgi:NAD(P)-dependent dehydrogenase (short-subunit alcohol dehydrogenase family)
MIGIDLEGRVAVVTGGSSGIGARTAQVLARAGARVLVVGRDRARLDATVAAIEHAGGVAAACRCDLADPDAVAEIVAAAAQLGPEVDCVLHAAGHFARTAFAEIGQQELDALWAVHVRAPFLLTQALLPSLTPGASVLFYSSTVAQTGFAPYSAYTAVKGAVEALARSLAVELAPAVRVNILVPGFTETPILTDQYAEAPELAAAIVARTPVGFIDDGDSIAHLAAYLCSDQARYVDGARFVVDGGWVAQGWQAA